MITIERPINVYALGVPLIIRLSQYDDDFTLVFDLYSSDGNFQLQSGTTAEIRGTKKDGNGYSADCTIDIATAKVTVAGNVQMTACAGRNVFELVLSKSGKVLSTANFILQVEPSAMDADTVPSESVIKEIGEAVTEYLDEHDFVTDPTLTISGRAADAKATGDEIADLKSDLEKKSGLSAEAKVALLACFANVAWINEDGQTYYDNLEAALYNDYPKITATFSPGVNVIYTDDELDTLKQYLTVKYYTSKTDTGTNIPAENYTLSGMLRGGENTICVVYNTDYKTTFIVNAIDFYELSEHIFPDNMVVLGGSAGIGNQGGVGYEPIYNGTVTPYVRASFWVNKGRKGQQSVYDTKTQQRMNDVFAIPVPTNATIANVIITPSTNYVNIRRYLYDESTQTWVDVRDETGWQLGSGTLNIPASEYDRYVSISSKFNSGGTSGDLPTGLTITFE